MTTADPLGLPAAPHETFQALMQRLEGSELSGGRLLLVTDRQGERWRAVYAALVKVQGEEILTAPAFGPRFGEAGQQSLAQLVQWATRHELVLRETVLNTSDFNRVLAEPEPHEVAALWAASNPTDAGIYTAKPKAEEWA